MKITFTKFIQSSLAFLAIGCSSIAPSIPEQKISDRQITIAKSPDIAIKRQKLISFIWGKSGFPKTKQPESIAKNVQSPVRNLQNLERVDTLNISMDAGVKGLAHHFIPQQKKNRVVILNPGHSCTFDDGIGSGNTDNGMQRIINKLLSQGYSVLAVYMPHQNPTDCSRNSDHDEMFKLTTTGNAIKFFMEPVAVSLNYLQAKFPAYQDFNMVGISGGGWTTTVYAAIDPRIKSSIPIAGSVPLYLRFPTPPNQIYNHDLEQYLPSFYRLAGYLDLYILGAYGENRQQTQILIRQDNCCFGEKQHQTAKIGSPFERSVRDYESQIQTVLKKFNSGYFRLYIDEVATMHTISDYAIDNIIMPALNRHNNISTRSIFSIPELIDRMTISKNIHIF